MADDVLRRWYASLGKARRELPALRRGSIRWWNAEGKPLSFLREGEGQPVLTAVNIADEYFKEVEASENLRRQLKEYLEEATKLKMELSEAKREIFKLQNQKK